MTVTESPSIPSTAPQFTDPALFTLAILNRTNTYRAAHNASAVRYNGTLAACWRRCGAGEAGFWHLGRGVDIPVCDLCLCMMLWDTHLARAGHGTRAVFSAFELPCIVLFYTV